jgi:broad specificity phosphatase PhoE
MSPKVGKRTFPYTPRGIAQAKKLADKKKAGKKKEIKKKRGY